ncbi:MAG TPA: ATP-binding protein, partial [Candidatus Limnocylindrales bacterium]
MSPFKYARDALVFAPCYVALDWASYIDPVGPFNITPWNPQAALALVWLLLGGLHYAPAVLVTIVVAEAMVRHAPGGYLITLLTAVTLAGGYAAIASVLRALVADLGLRSSRHLTVFIGVAVAGSAIVGAAFVGVLRGADLLGDTPLPNAWLRFWIGDAVGILVTAPLLLAAADRERRAGMLALARRRETLVQAVVLSGTIWLIFHGLGGDPGHHFYALFVPLIWIAARGGMNAAIVATAIVQLGVVAGIHAESTPDLPILEIQALVAALTLTGLYLGMMVDEREQAAASLRQTLRLAAAGDMAGAIAHELNQPLTALSNYGQSALMLSAAGADGQRQVPAVIAKMLAEAERASEVVRRLRDFFRSGTTRLEELPADELQATVQRIARQIIGTRAVALDVQSEPGLPALYVDRMQIELVIRNLIANAVEALDKQAGTERRIGVRLGRQGDTDLDLTFVDTGPGLPAEMVERVFEPFVSGKPTGMGLGLAVSRTIAEAHGGTLEAAPGARA